jgi:chromosome segregation ATPase
MKTSLISKRKICLLGLSRFTGMGSFLTRLGIICPLVCSFIGATSSLQYAEPVASHSSTVFGISSLSIVLSAATQEPKQDNVEEMRKTIQGLRREVERLKKKVVELEQPGHLAAVQDQLQKTEERAENLQSQLLAIDEKVATAQSRMDVLNEQLRPENISRMQITGSLRPEEVQETTRRHLSGEKQRIESRLTLLSESRARLQASLRDADVAILRLRAQLNAPHP